MLWLMPWICDHSHAVHCLSYVQQWFAWKWEYSPVCRVYKCESYSIAAYLSHPFRITHLKISPSKKKILRTLCLCKLKTDLFWFFGFFYLFVLGLVFGWFFGGGSFGGFFGFIFFFFWGGVGVFLVGFGGFFGVFVCLFWVFLGLFGFFLAFWGFFGGFFIWFGLLSLSVWKIKLLFSRQVFSHSPVWTQQH